MYLDSDADIDLPREFVRDLRERRGFLHPSLDFVPERTALVVVDMQNGFVAPGAVLEVPSARQIVPRINELAQALRQAGGTVVWLNSVFSRSEPHAGWAPYFRYLVSEERAGRILDELGEGADGTELWHELDVREEDRRFTKARFSAFMPDPKPFSRLLAEAGVETLLITGTVTNICCEATARDAMMSGFNIVMVSDANAARTEAEHQATLVSCIQIVGDVRRTGELLSLYRTAELLVMPNA